MEQLLLQPVLAVLGAFVGAYFGSRRFVHERTWEAKRQAYEQIVEAIHKINYWAEQHYARLHFLPTAPHEKFAQLALSFESAREDLWRYSTIGELLISEAATMSVHRLRNNLEKAAFWFEEEQNPDNYEENFGQYCDLVHQAVKHHLPEIIMLAKNDLSGRGGWRWMREGRVGTGEDETK